MSPAGPHPQGPPADALLQDAEEDGDLEAEEAGRDARAWEREYADERSWEMLQEDDAGLLRALDVTAQQRERRRRHLAAPAARIRRGMIRYLVLVVDLSRAAAEVDFHPSRMAVVAALVEVFIREFFDQNPLSHLGIIALRAGVAQRLTELSGSPQSHITALKASLGADGEASLQNGLDLARAALAPIPAYGHREVVVVSSALTTCDPGDIHAAIAACKKHRIRCSVVGLAAEVYICATLARLTGGTYTIATSEGHLRDLLLEHAPPPPALQQDAPASLIRMGFPQRQPDGAASICACHADLRLDGAYVCPRCKARVCELPTECHVCSITLMSSPHLARSYHHLFPVPPYDEWQASSSSAALPATCFACQAGLPGVAGGATGVRLVCPRCARHFCFDCDAIVHESLHNCPGCECRPAAPDDPPG
ncbi:putative von Willebrand factor type A [Klebsormidium nitens]|uniref:General transcription factor IIH subunit n=1 Tax=Klebsormidium nitens TaxID=105231 RepID=A0A1Y1IK24_KLENI|nr:putative von Willebrand factor type A [Klebsormidium nitens]|eukprot:GAQ91083.1 putative von Willebrand factor type A [Klebsormidium nitens]